MKGPTRVILATVLCGPLSAQPAVALDWRALWDFDRPALTEQRLRDALVQARGEETLVLRTQIARTYSLRQRFDDAHRELDAIATAAAAAGPEVRALALLERGRTFRSAGQPAMAAPLFERAAALAQGAGLERLAGDALHMVALVQPTPQAELAANDAVIAYGRQARDPAARHWVAVALNNQGVVLNQLGRHAEALVRLQAARQAYEHPPAGVPDAARVRVARWMVAHTLRRLGRIDEALAQQQALERDFDAVGSADPHVFEELALLHRARGDEARAALYDARRRAAAGAPP